MGYVNFLEGIQVQVLSYNPAKKPLEDEHSPQLASPFFKWTFCTDKNGRTRYDSVTIPATWIYLISRKSLPTTCFFLATKTPGIPGIQMGPLLLWLEKGLVLGRGPPTFKNGLVIWVIEVRSPSCGWCIFLPKGELTIWRLTPWKINILNPNIEVWLRWFSFSSGWFLGSSC